MNFQRDDFFADDTQANERDFPKRHLNIALFDAWHLPRKGVHHGASLALLATITTILPHNGYCTLSNNSLIERASLTRHQLRRAKAKLQEAKIVDVRARSGIGGSLTNAIFRRPITRAMLQAYADATAIAGFGDANTVVVRKDGEPLRGLHESMFADDVPDEVVGVPRSTDT